jgi:hypothetical protein
VAAPISVSTQRDTAVSITLSASDVDNDPLHFVVVSPPVHGTLLGSGAALAYTPNLGYVGTDSFTYVANDGTVDSSVATVSITVTAALALSLADDASRATNLRPLAGAVLRSGVSAYVFVDGSALRDVRRVSFSLDGNPFSVETLAPFDFAGTSTTRPCRGCAFNAFPFESNLLSLGSHVITATALMRNGSRIVLTSAFTVADTTPHSLVVSTSPDRSSPIALSGATLFGRRFIFLGDAADSIAGLGKVVFVLDGKTIRSDSSAPYDAEGTTRNGSPIALDTRFMRNGTHRLTAIVQLKGEGIRIVYTAVFQVAN